MTPLDSSSGTLIPLSLVQKITDDQLLVLTVGRGITFVGDGPFASLFSTVDQIDGVRHTEGEFDLDADVGTYRFSYTMHPIDEESQLLVIKSAESGRSGGAKERTLQTIGELAAGVAHELNTPMQYISDNVHFLEDSTRDLLDYSSKLRELVAEEKQDEAERIGEEADLSYLTDELPKAYEQTLNGLGNLTTMVKSLKAFSHPDEGGIQNHDLNRSLEEVITISRNEWKYHAEVETAFDEALTPFPCKISQINRAVLNLIVNAAHAIRDGSKGDGIGKIRVTTEMTDEGVTISVQDDGPGIPEKIRDQVFDSFFTTKKAGEGTGQGLSFVKKIIEGHNGHIHLQSEPGNTQFKLMIPRAEG